MDWKKGAQYWDHAWNPVIGCKPVSEGCRNCYAASMAQRFPELQDETGGFLPHPPKAPKAPPKSGVVFVGNMTDLFGEWNTDQQICNWLYYLQCTATYLVLTKRAERLKKISPYFVGSKIVPHSPHWFGVTAENQSELDARAEHFMSSGLNQKWFSLEPLLGPMNIIPYIGYNAYRCDCGWHETERTLQLACPDEDGFWGLCRCIKCGKRPFQTRAAQWVVVGAESGPNRRPCKLEWVESIVEQCQSAGVPVFVKQLDIGGKLVKDIEKFPEHLRIRQVPWGGKE